MKSNQLNIIATLLLVTAGLSAENVSYFQTAKDKASKTLSTVKGYMPEASLKNAGIGALVVAVPTAAYTGYKRFFENKAVVSATNGQDVTEVVNAKGYNKDAFTTVVANLNLKKRQPSQEIADARLNIDNACYNTGYKLQWALRKMYYNPVKTAATVLGLLGTGYAIHHYGLDTKAMEKINAGASTVYNVLPAKPTWFGMPTFVSNLLGKKAEQPAVEKQAPVEKRDENPYQTGL